MNSIIKPTDTCSSSLQDLCSPELDPLYWPSALAGVESAWVSHTPFAHWLIAVHKPRSIVELGTHRGVSYVAFCEAVQRLKLDCRCYAVDTWEGDQHSGFYQDDVYFALRRIHDVRFGGFSELVRSTFDAALSYIPDASVDLLHIDGLHTYDAVQHDFQAWRCKLTDRAVVLLHDTNVRERDFGVWRLFAELKAEFPSFEFLHGHGLGVVLIGSQCDAELVGLADLPSQATGSVRERFSFLGERWAGEMQVTLARAQLITNEKALQNYRSQIADLEAHAGRLGNHAGGLERLASEQADVVEALHAERATTEARHQTEVEILRSEKVTAEARHLTEVEILRSEQTAAEARHLTEVEILRFEQTAANARHLTEINAKHKVVLAAQEQQAVAERARMQAEQECKATLHAITEAELRNSAAKERESYLVGLVDQAHQEAASSRTALGLVHSSTSWRVTFPLRRMAESMPYSLRRTFRGTAKLAWWSATLRLPSKLRHRQQLLQRYRLEQALADRLITKAPDADTIAILPADTTAILPHASAPNTPQLTLITPGSRTETIDIIICVHNALSSVRDCINSVLQSTMPPYRIILVDDGSGRETAVWLDEIAAQQHLTVLRNSTSTGYTRAANIGLRAVSAPWAVLLNSDTVVTPGWLDRMWAHGARDTSIGVVGPLSNTASWQSIPQVFTGEDWAENPLPMGLDIEGMSRLVARSGFGAVPLPFINGFCYMIRAEALRVVGLFDEETFGAGYGEENDFSIRVRQAGFSLVVATDAYVFHAQSMSYSQDRRLLLANAADENLARKHDPRRDIWPQATACRESLHLVSMRSRVAAEMERCRLRDAGQRFEGKRVAFILPVAEVGGGANVILQEGMALQRMGIDVTLLNLEGAQRSFGRVPELDVIGVRTFVTSEALTAHLASGEGGYDAIVATLYRTVFWLPLQKQVRLGYYIQDYEPYFFADSDPEQRTALMSYTLSDRVRLMTKTQWNRTEVVHGTGRLPVVLGPSVEGRMFYPGPKRPHGARLQITAMLRPNTPRRAPDRTLAVLDGIMATFGEQITVEVFGTDQSDLAAAGLTRPWLRNAGRLSREQLASLLRHSEVFIDCSDYQAMGLTALEAMLSGCAVVAPERGGTNDFIRTGVNGILVDSTDIGACIAAVSQLLRDDELRQTLRARAIEDANRWVPEGPALRLLESLFDE